jgi:hypothetical protein
MRPGLLISIADPAGHCAGRGVLGTAFGGAAGGEERPAEAIERLGLTARFTDLAK